MDRVLRKLSKDQACQALHGQSSLSRASTGGAGCVGADRLGCEDQLSVRGAREAPELKQSQRQEQGVPEPVDELFQLPERKVPGPARQTSC